MQYNFGKKRSLILNKNQIDIVGLNETRLNQTSRDHKIYIDRYQIFRNDRNKDGGGVASYVKDSLADVKVKLTCDQLELLCLEITPRKAKSMHVLNMLV